MFPKSISWFGMEKQNLTQQKHTFTDQKECTTTQNEHKKTKARFSHLPTTSGLEMERAYSGFSTS